MEKPFWFQPTAVWFVSLTPSVVTVSRPSLVTWTQKIFRWKPHSHRILNTFCPDQRTEEYTFGTRKTERKFAFWKEIIPDPYVASNLIRNPWWWHQRVRIWCFGYQAWTTMLDFDSITSLYSDLNLKSPFLKIWFRRLLQWQIEPFIFDLLWNIDNFKKEMFRFRTL